MQSNLDQLKAQYSYPETRPDFKPFYWCLDDGGRELIKELILERKISLMVEIGVFFGGSSKQWLETSSELTVIGIDPFPKLVGYFVRTAHLYKETIDYGELDYDLLRKQLDRQDSTYHSALSNLWSYRERFIPIRGRSPEKLYELQPLPG